MRIRLVEEDEQTPQTPLEQENQQNKEEDKLADFITKNVKDTKTTENKVEEYMSKLFGVDKKQLPSSTQLVTQEVINNGVIPTKTQLEQNKSNTVLQYLYNQKVKNGKNFPNNQQALIVFNLLRQGDPTTQKLLKDTNSVLYDEYKPNAGENVDDSLYKFKTAIFLSNPNNISRFFDEKPYTDLKAFLQQDASKIKSDLHGAQTKSGDDRISIEQWAKQNEISDSNLIQKVADLTEDTDAVQIFENALRELREKHSDEFTKPMVRENTSDRQVIAKILQIADEYGLKTFVMPRVNVYLFTSLNEFERGRINAIIEEIKKRYEQMEKTGQKIPEDLKHYIENPQELRNALATIYKQSQDLKSLKDTFFKLMAINTRERAKRSTAKKKPQANPQNQPQSTLVRGSDDTVGHREYITKPEQ